MSGPHRNPPNVVERLVTEHWTFMMWVANQHLKKVGGWGDQDSVISDASYGLLRAAMTFDSDTYPDSSFVSHARRRIEGQIIDGYRTRLGRNGQKLSTIPLSAIQVGDDNHDLMSTADVNAGVELGVIEPGFEALEDADEAHWLASHVDEMSLNQASVMHAIYDDGQSMTEVAEVRGTTVSAVCQLHRSATGSLRKRALREQRAVDGLPTAA